MAEIQAFRAYRYDLGRVGTLADVVAPPYDVIDADLQERLYNRSPYNVIRLILNREEKGDADADAKYQRAGRCLKDWLREGILVQDSARSVYVYHQVFKVEDKEFTRRGVLARVRLEPFGQGKIFPHEETMPGPKADRLKLMHATGMNLSPVFGLYPDPQGEVQASLDRAISRSLPLEATDHLGVVNRLWPLSDTQTISAITGMLGPKPVFIADGHHRYETALKYLEERRAMGTVRDDDPAHYVLMMLVGMSDPGLVILPTHRLVSGVPQLRRDDLARMLGDHFDLETVGQGEKGARATWEWIEADGSQNVLGFITVDDGVWQLARLRSPDVMAEICPQHSSAWRSLGVSILHELVLSRLLPAACTGASPSCRYVHLLQEVIDAVAKRECQLGVLVPPAKMTDVEKIASGNEKMPPKSTYFYPKLLSGLVFNPL
ncbi:MAG: phosphatase [Gemmatales bacterium]|nr:MAG: phosphatase [Gemmatales bacterium]